jgi:peptidoglycan/LPS O-acetylase OafA/YrhL
MNPRRWSAFLLGLVLGAAIWFLSPWLTGRSEPWDSESGFYAGALLATGALGGLLFPRHWPSVSTGIFAGQLLVIIGGVLADPASGGFWPLGVVFLAVYSALAVVGAVLGAALRRGRRPVFGSPDSR